MKKLLGITVTFGILACILSILFVCVIPSSITASWFEPNEKIAIEARYNEFYGAVKRNEYSKAYPLMTERFRSQYSLERFQERVEIFAVPLRPTYGVSIDKDKATLHPSETEPFSFWYGTIFMLKKENGIWLIDEMYIAVD